MPIPTHPTSPTSLRVFTCTRPHAQPHRQTRRVRALLAGMLALSLLAGCAGRQAATMPYAPMDSAARSPMKAEQLNQEAAALLESDPGKAEGLLRDALGADLYFGPAHNNLGVLFLKQGKLYEAAGEFEWARKLLPGHPDPRLNLSLVLERAGRIDDAIKNAQTALEIHPGHIASLEQLCHLELKYATEPSRPPSKRSSSPSSVDRDDLRAHLMEIALRGESMLWQDWARQQLIKLDARP